MKETYHIRMFGYYSLQNYKNSECFSIWGSIELH